MSTSYPGTIQTFSNPSGTSTLDSPDHAGLHTNLADTLGAAQAVMGTTAGTSVLKNFADGDFSTRINSSGVLQQTVQGTINLSTFGTPTVTGGTFASPSTTGTDSGTATLTNKTLTSPTLGGTPVLDADSAVPFYNDSMYRQAIINGNFDVWQRGTTSTNPTSNTYAVADRWKANYVNNGTLPTNIVHSRQLITSGGLDGAFYHYRIAPDGAGSGFGVSDEYYIRQQIENGIRLLAGTGNNVTISFWAKSDIADKKIGVRIKQYYGSGGSPSSVETINGTNVTLTSSWQKITHTFALNSLSGKTFGTVNDDGILLDIGVMWGTTTDEQWGDTVAETFVGSGNIDIAQVQLCAGSVDLPFMPKSIAEEKLDCKRYFERIQPSTAYQMLASGFCTATTNGAFCLLYEEKRIAPTFTFTAGSTFAINHGSDAATAVTSIAINAGRYGNKSANVHAAVAAGLTVGQGATLNAGATASSCYIDLSAEL